MAHVPGALARPGPVAAVLRGVAHHPVPIGIPLPCRDVVLVRTASGPLPTPSALAPAPGPVPPPVPTGLPVTLPLLLRHRSSLPVLGDGPHVLPSRGA